MKRTFLFLFLATMIVHSGTQAQLVIPLYEAQVPNSRAAPDEEWQEQGADSILRIHAVSKPSLTVFLPDKKKRTGDAVVICPGGGYRILAADHEGYSVARKFAAQGIAAFVVKYRLPDDRTMVDKSIGPLQDAQRALQMVRGNARKWGIRRVGIMGFSAGGHLAATAGTQFNRELIPNKKKISLRPDFMVLVYPVISFQDSIGHMGSRDNLLGKNPPREKITAYSNELQVTPQTPPTFLIHAKDDGGVKVANSTLFAEALKRAGVPHKIYLYEKGGHGFGMINKTSDVRWMDQVGEWMGELRIKN